MEETSSPLCQALFEDIQGIKLEIDAIPKTGAILQFCLNPAAPSVPNNHRTLKSLLDSQEVLRIRERRILALVLMYSFMQLLGGRWLNEYWDDNDILFFQVEEHNPPEFNFRQPYFSASWKTAERELSQSKRKNTLHPMPDMVTVARFLLELELQDTRYSPKLAQHSGSDLRKASDFLKKLKDWGKDRVGTELFVQSMESCLNPETYNCCGSQSPNLPLIWEIYQKIVYPLEQDLLAILGKKATWSDLETELSTVALPNESIMGAEFIANDAISTRPK